jgi:hypothetical protein
MNKEKNCVICFESNCIFNGPSNSDIDTDCTHYFCVDCIQRMYQEDVNCCPICRRDWTDWIQRQEDDD